MSTRFRPIDSPSGYIGVGLIDLNLEALVHLPTGVCNNEGLANLSTFPHLSPGATARINQARAIAHTSLEGEIVDFLRKCDSGEIFRTLKHRPASTDLIPFFEKYASAVFDAEASEGAKQVRRPRDVARYNTWLENRIEDLVVSIGKRGGTWEGAVQDCARIANFLAGGSPYGRYSAATLQRARMTVIDASLGSRKKHWIGAAWESVATNSQTGIRHVAKTTLARNLDRFMTECGWSYDELAAATGVHRTSIIDHVVHGNDAYPGTLAKYAKAFEARLRRPVQPADLIRH